jgi:hypothetical protein
MASARTSLTAPRPESALKFLLCSVAKAPRLAARLLGCHKPSGEPTTSLACIIGSGPEYRREVSLRLPTVPSLRPSVSVALAGSGHASLSASEY